MNKKNIYKGLILLSYLIIFLLFFVFEIRWECPFKKFLHIACPGCGLTRSFKAILKLNFIESLRYNLLGIPIVIFVAFSIVFLIKDIIKKEDVFFEKVKQIFDKYYVIIISIIVIVTIINNVNHI